MRAMADAAAMADGRVQLGFIEVTNPGGCDKLHVVKVLVTGRSRGEGLYKVVNLDIGVKSKFRKDIYVRRGERKKCEVQVKSEREVALEKREEAVRGREMMMRSKMEEKETSEKAILGRMEALQGQPPRHPGGRAEGGAGRGGQAQDAAAHGLMVKLGNTHCMPFDFR